MKRTWLSLLALILVGTLLFAGTPGVLAQTGDTLEIWLEESGAGSAYLSVFLDPFGDTTIVDMVDSLRSEPALTVGEPSDLGLGYYSIPLSWTDFRGAFPEGQWKVENGFALIGLGDMSNLETVTVHLPGQVATVGSGDITDPYTVVFHNPSLTGISFAVSGTVSPTPQTTTTPPPPPTATVLPSPTGTPHPPPTVTQHPSPTATPPPPPHRDRTPATHSDRTPFSHVISPFPHRYATGHDRRRGIPLVGHRCHRWWRGAVDSGGHPFVTTSTPATDGRAQTANSRSNSTSTCRRVARGPFLQQLRSGDRRANVLLLELWRVIEGTGIFTSTAQYKRARDDHPGGGRFHLPTSLTTPSASIKFLLSM
jgi:hypothetical protein